METTNFQTAINQIARQRGYDIQDRAVFSEYLKRGGFEINVDGKYAYRVDRTCTEVVYQPAKAEVEQSGNLIASRDNGAKLYRIGDMEFIVAPMGEVVTRHESVRASAWFPIDI